MTDRLIRTLAFIERDETPDSYRHPPGYLEGPWASNEDDAIAAYRIASGDRSRFVQTWLRGGVLWIAIEREEDR